MTGDRRGNFDGGLKQVASGYQRLYRKEIKDLEMRFGINRQLAAVRR